MNENLIVAHPVAISRFGSLFKIVEMGRGSRTEAVTKTLENSVIDTRNLNFQHEAHKRVSWNGRKTERTVVILTKKGMNESSGR
jgi:hypothetical protein